MPSLHVNPTLHYLDAEPDIAAFVATALPEDPERDRLVNDYRRQLAALERVASRQKAVAHEIEATVDALTDVPESSEWNDLLDRYQRSTTEQLLLPTVRSKIARRMAGSLAAWLRVVRPQLDTEIRRRGHAYGQLWDELEPERELAARLAKRTDVATVEDLNRHYVDPQRLPQFDEAVARIAQAEALKAQLDEARRIDRLISDLTRQHFGLNTNEVPTYLSMDTFVDRVAGRVRPAAA